MLQGLVAKAEKVGNVWNIAPYDSPCEPEVTGTSSYFVDASLTVSVNLDYPNESVASWWLYRNGALYDYWQGNALERSWELTEPGEYVPMCSLRDRYFSEFYFCQFDKVVIA